MLRAGLITFTDDFTGFKGVGFLLGTWLYWYRSAL